MELMKAHRQWATRPEDERYPNLQQLYEATKKSAEESAEALSPLSKLRVEAIDGDLKLLGKTEIPASLNNWSFQQLCRRVGAPAGYLEGLPSKLAAQNLNHGLDEMGQMNSTRDANLLFGISDNNLILRSMMTDAYSRIWNHEVVERLLMLQEMGWEPAMPDIRKTLNDFPALYAGDRDMFAFICNDEIRVHEAGNPDGLQRGLIVENSEVGASCLKLTRFLYREMCGNHIIWGASQVVELSLRHVGNVRQRFGMYQAEIKKYAESSATEEQAKIANAKRKIIASDKDELLDKLFQCRSVNLPRKTLEMAYEATKPDEDGSPLSQWGIVQGLTRYSQSIAFCNLRNQIDIEAGKILQIDF